MVTERSAGRTRRRYMQVGIATLGALALGSVSSWADDGDGTTTGADGAEARLESVPADADLVAYVDVDAVLDDEATAAVVDAVLADRAGAMHDDGPTSFAALRDRIDRQTPAALDDLQEAVAFTSFDRGEPAYLLWTDWSEAEFVATLESLAAGEDSLASRSYRDRTLYVEPESRYGPRGAGAVLADGTYVVSTRPVVESVVDVAAGEVDSLAGPVRDAFGAVTPGPVRFALDVPQEQLGRADQGQQYGRVVGAERASHRHHGAGLAALADVSRISGSVAVDGDVRRLEISFDADSPETASDLAATLQSQLDMFARSMREPEAQALLEDAEVTQPNSDVVLTVEATVAELEALARAMGEPERSRGQRQGTPTGSDRA